MKLFVGVVSGLSVFFLLSFCADAKNFMSVESEELWMQVNKDSTIDVTESRKVMLHGNWTYMTREFLLLGCDDIKINELKINNDNYIPGNLQKKGEYSLSLLGPRLHGKGSLADRLQLRWRCNDPDDGPFDFTIVRYTIKYRLIGAIGRYQDYDLLSWDPLRVYRKHFIREAKVRVIFPDAIKPLKVYFNCDAVAPHSDVAPGGRMITFGAKGISPEDYFRFYIRFPKGVVGHYSSFNNTYYYNLKPWTLPVFIGLTVLVLLVLYIMRGHEPKVAAEQMASVKLNLIRPGLTGLVMNESFNNYDMCATILDLARRGYLRITQLSSNQADEAAEYEIRLVQAPPPGGLLHHEEILLTELFGNILRDSRITTRQLEYSFYRKMPHIRHAAWKDAAGWYATTPQRARNSFLCIGLLIAAVGISLAAVKIPIAIFLALWCVIFGGIPIYRIIHSVKENGWRGVRDHFVYLPLVLVGVGVAIYSVCCAYPWTGWMFDCGVALFISGLLVVAFGPAMARRNSEGCVLAHRLMQLEKQLRAGEVIPDMDADERLVWSVAMECYAPPQQDTMPNIDGLGYLRLIGHPHADGQKAEVLPFDLVRMVRAIAESMSSISRINRSATKNH